MSAFADDEILAMQGKDRFDPGQSHAYGQHAGGDRRAAKALYARLGQCLEARRAKIEAKEWWRQFPMMKGALAWWRREL